MIQLTRLNGKSIVVNSDLIEFIENTPDTVITLVTGEKVVVAETTQEILNLVILFRRRLLPASLASLPPIVLSSQDGMRNEPE
jgi:flagellar protein FlbD